VTVADIIANKEYMGKLRDPHWRLTSGFYKVVNKESGVVPFVPNRAQREVLDLVFKDGVKRLIIVKARQIGFSALIELMMLDYAHFSPNVSASLVDQTQADASKKLDEKCRFAFNNLEEWLRSPSLPVDSGREMSFANGSSIFAGMNARGGTNHFLHVSELGPIAFDDANRADEVRRGALPSVPDSGYCFIESTFMGGKGGMFYEMIKHAQETPDALKTVKDFRWKFFGWFDGPDYTLGGDMSRVSRQTHEYLDHVQALTGKKFTDGQRLWYQVTKDDQGIFMGSEYPSTIEECWSSPVKGAIYADIIDRIRAAGQIADFDWDRAYPVWCSWDIGFGDTTDIWWWQLRLNRMDVIKHVSLGRHSAAQAANVVREAGIPVAGHLLPHDAGNHSSTGGSSYQQELQRAGLLNLRVVPRTHDAWIGINQVRDMLPRCTFNLRWCAEGLGALEVYHSKDDSQGAVVSREPVHDWSSHAADAFRTAVEAINANMVSGASVIARDARGRGARDFHAWESGVPA